MKMSKLKQAVAQIALTATLLDGTGGFIISSALTEGVLYVTASASIAIPPVAVAVAIGIAVAVGITYLDNNYNIKLSNYVRQMINK